MLLSACHYPYAAPARPAVTVYDGGVYYAPYRSYGYSHGYAYRHYRYYRYYDRHRHHSFHSHGHY
ncbi:MAG: hypothetical protein D6826_06335 [Alphaproteobacteria bacterium]|nr:MAG: hypothetical protein D6826_06335 [Alphaproteobacteria bacterium]